MFERHNLYYCFQDEFLLLYLWWRRRQRRQRRASPDQWVSDFLSRRHLKGAYQNLVKEIEGNDLDRFYNFHRMSPEQFNYLLEKVEPLIKRQDVVRESLSPGLRLSLTLRLDLLKELYDEFPSGYSIIHIFCTRYLASGDSMVSLHYLYLVSKSSITRVIPETCNAIWQVLAPDVLKLPSTTREWERIAEDFEKQWDFPNCVGAIDGKHVIAQVRGCPEFILKRHPYIPQ